MPTPHKHAEVIRAFADGATIQVGYPTGEWVDNAYPHFDEKVQYRVKPEPAAPKWPQTTMTSAGLSIAYVEKVSDDALRDVANAAIAHACEAGQLVPADKVREIEAKARAEGIKEGRRKEQELRRHEVDFGAGYNRVGYDIGYQGRTQK